MISFEGFMSYKLILKKIIMASISEHRGSKMDHNLPPPTSSVWVQQLFKNDEESGSSESDDMSEWYNNFAFGMLEEPTENSTETNSSKKSKVSITRKSQTIKGFLSKPQHNPIDTQEVIYKNQCCGGNRLAKIKLELENNVGILDDEDKDPNANWICRPPKPGRVKKRENKLSNIHQLFDRIIKRADEAMNLLLTKFENGLIISYPSFSNKVSAKSFGSGEAATSNTPTDSNTKIQTLYKSPKTLQEDMMNYLDNIDLESLEMASIKLPQSHSTDTIENVSFCPVFDMDIEEYLQEPLAKYLLQKAGAIDEKERILCTFKDFYDVEHAVKKYLVNLAKESIEKSHLNEGQNMAQNHQMKQTEMSKLGLFKSKIEKREQLTKVLRENLSECCPHMLPPEKPRRRTKIFWESLPSKIYLTPASERQKSLAKEQYAEELTEKLLATLNRRSLIGETDEHGDLIELMPVRDSFNVDHLDGESNENNINLTDKRRKSWIHLEEPVKAEFKRYWKFPQRAIPPNKGTEHISFTQWQNYSQLEDFIQRGVNKRERVLFIQLKYFFRWIVIWKKNKALRKYSPDAMSDEDFKEPKSLWGGPFPSYVLNRIRNMEGMAHYEPKSPHSFYKALRKLEANMLEKAKIILNNLENDDDENKAGGPPISTKATKENLTSVDDKLDNQGMEEEEMEYSVEEVDESTSTTELELRLAEEEATLIEKTGSVIYDNSRNEMESDVEQDDEQEDT